jgi:DNA-binding LacI/PurR family transcriptional regulator
MSQVSILDIARALGVSASTVSRALQNHPRISAERRATIQGLALEMGYRPNQVARSLVTGRTCAIGVVVTDVTDPFVAEVMKGAEAASREQGYTLLFAMSNRDLGQEIDAMQFLLDREVDGMVVISGRATPRYAALRLASGREWPLVLVNNQAHGPGIFGLSADNEGGMMAAVRHLLLLGHRSIAFLAGPRHGRSASERLAGYRMAMAAAGAPEILLGGSGLLEDGTSFVAWLRESLAQPTAVVCYNDLSAVGVLAAASAAGLKVPDALSVVGYDNIPLSGHTVPPLTTVEQPCQSMGRRAIELCIRAIAGEPVEDAVLRGHLVIRKSTGPVRPNPSLSPKELSFQ